MRPKTRSDLPSPTSGYPRVRRIRFGNLRFSGGRLRILFSSNVKSIREGDVEIAVEDSVQEIPNDAVVVSAGGILPSAFLKTVGVHVETKWGSK